MPTIPAPRSPEPTPPIRVLSLVKGLGRGGAESLLLLSARRSDRDAFAQSLAYLTPANNDLVHEIEAEGAGVTCIGGDRWWDPRWLVRFRQHLTAHPVDIVHAHSPIPAVGARLVLRTIRRRARPKMVTTEHNVWASHHPATRLVDKITFGLDDAHLAVSEAVRASVPQAHISSVEVVIHGVDVDAVSAEGNRVEARRELGVGDDEVLIGTVANLRAQKAYPDLLRAARAVLDRVPAARFVAIGKGPAETEVHALHHELGLGDRFMLLGYRHDAARLASGFDIFCLASHHEGLPVALMEALVLGIPVVATTAGGIAELVTDDVEGRLVPTGRPTELAAALTAVATNPVQLRRYAEAAAERGRSLSVDTAIRKTEDVYRSLLQSRSDSHP